MWVDTYDHAARTTIYDVRTAGIEDEVRPCSVDGALKIGIAASSRIVGDNRIGNRNGATVVIDSACIAGSLIESDR